MRDLFETIALDDPVTAARRGTRLALRRRFYDQASAEKTGERYCITLDGKPVKTPARRALAAPNLVLAHAIAGEWEAQREVIDPASMPLTRLANSIIDGVTDSPAPAAAEIEKYLAYDLLFYRAGSPQQLRDRQAKQWDPILAWASAAFDASFTLGEGVIHVLQPETALQAVGGAIPTHPWRLGAAQIVTTLTGSALIALALSHGALSSDAAWQAAHVDEDWNMERWGRDEIALEQRAFRFAEFQAAAMTLSTIPE